MRLKIDNNDYLLRVYHTNRERRQNHPEAKRIVADLTILRRKARSTCLPGKTKRAKT